ncbi:hypothetical protein [Clostridium sp.]|uniref:hypothetical protein n=1 Tax=Clostridium sp. TaxID=1506 RepID=UPI003F35B85D
MRKITLNTRLCNWRININTDRVEIIQLINSLFGQFICKEFTNTNVNTMCLSIKYEENKYYLISKNKSYYIDDIEKVGFYLYRIIDNLSEAYSKDEYCIFHGGGIGKNGKSYGIIAPTTTGKSTFITCLVHKGYEYISDDYIFVDRKNYSMRTFKMPISLRSKELFGDLINDKIISKGYNPLTGQNNYLVSDYKEHNTQDKYPFSSALFISREGDNSLKEISKGELYKNLIFNLKNTKHLEKDIETIAEICKSVRGYKLTYNNLKYAQECLDILVKE